MAKVRSGTRVGRSSTVILKQGAAGGLRKMRCPHCQGLASPKQTGTGKITFVCGTANCRAEFSAGKF